MRARLLLMGALLAGCASSAARRESTESAPPWANDPVYEAIAHTLDGERAIDNHTHLRLTDANNWAVSGPIKPADDPRAGEPFDLLKATGFIRLALAHEFGVGAQGDLDPAIARAIAIRDERRRQLGQHGYWLAHLDRSRTEVVLVNKPRSDGTDGLRLRWVPQGDVLLYPVPVDASVARNPVQARNIPIRQEELRREMEAVGATSLPSSLQDYVVLVDRVLEGWKRQGAVALKFGIAYTRTLKIEDIPIERASALYDRGRETPLRRSEYLELQDFLLRAMFRSAGRLDLPVHIHSSAGVPPFLRLYEADVRNLETVLTDPTFAGTQFVLIHGGYPLVREAAYLSLKRNVWIDISALPFVRPVPDVANMLREYLLEAPERVLFGTDAAREDFAGSEVDHTALSLAARQALYLALAGLVRDRVIDSQRAIATGKGVLRDNAKRLYGWQK